jgi:hypothetical protein
VGPKKGNGEPGARLRAETGYAGIGVPPPPPPSPDTNWPGATEAWLERQAAKRADQARLDRLAERRSWG